MRAGSYFHLKLQETFEPVLTTTLRRHKSSWRVQTGRLRSNVSEILIDEKLVFEILEFQRTQFKPRWRNWDTQPDVDEIDGIFTYEDLRSRR